LIRRGVNYPLPLFTKEGLGVGVTPLLTKEGQGVVEIL